MRKFIASALALATLAILTGPVSATKADNQATYDVAEVRKPTTRDNRQIGDDQPPQQNLWSNSSKSR